jgi:hypothetical protein
VRALASCASPAPVADEYGTLVVRGTTAADSAAAADLLAPLAAAGATWWEECDPDHLEQAASMFRRVDQGPPRPS